MITDITVEDYQAIKLARIHTGRLTVVTGPTGSGKSGLIRAMKLVAFNARGTSYVRHGAKTCGAGLGFQGDGYTVAIHRGSRGADKYVVAELVAGSPALQEYTKLEGKVPEEVQRLLGLKEINFAGQHDMPYLLTDSGSQVARVLGELTNVTLVLDAAREANRRKLETQRDLRQAEARLTELKKQAQGFRGLKTRRDAALEAREHLECIDQITGAWQRLHALVEKLGGARNMLRAAEKHLELTSVPSGERMTELADQRERLAELLVTWNGELAEAYEAADEAQNCQDGETRLHGELHQALLDAGRCPTCGQVVSE